MKKVTTNMTFAQLLFVLFILMLSSLMFFYLGAKFGADILTLADRENREAAEPFLPDDKLAAEIETLLADSGRKLVFHEVVQGKESLGAVTPKDDKTLKMTPATVVTTEAKLKAGQTAKDDVVPEPQIVKKSEAPTEEIATVKIADKPVPNNASPKSDLQPGTVIQPVAQNENVRKVIPPGSKTPIVAPPTDVANLKIITPPELAVKPKTQPENADILKDSLDQTLPAESSKVYRLQLGSYAQKNRALQAKSEWENRGYTVNLIATTIPGKGNWYRLQLGRFESLPEVQNVQRQIMKDYQQTAMILSGK